MIDKIDRREVQDILPLTPMQESMLFHYLGGTGTRPYACQFLLSLEGAIDTETMQRAWSFVIESNEMLRVVFRWEKVEHPVQVILKNHSCHLQEYDFSGLQPEKRTAAFASVKLEDRSAGFDLSEVPLRITLCKMDEHRYELLVSYHHILLDGWSNAILTGEFLAAYHAFDSGLEPGKPHKTAFKEYLRWRSMQDRAEESGFWKKYLERVEGPAVLPRQGSAAGNGTGNAIHTMNLTGSLQQKIRKFEKSHNITLAALLYTAWGLLLNRWTGLQDILFGTTVSGRPPEVPGIDNMAGLFINTLPLRLTIEPDCTLISLLEDTSRMLRERENYSAVSLTDIKADSPMRALPDIFDSIVVIENYPLEKELTLNPGPPAITAHSMDEQTHFDLVVQVNAFDAIVLYFNYNPAAFGSAAIQRMTGHLLNILEQAVNRPRLQAAQIEILSPREKEQLLHSFNNTDAGYPKEKTLAQLFEEQVEQRMERGKGEEIAAVDDHCSIGFAELNARANRLAHLLRVKGVAANRIVALLMNRSVNFLIAAWGILKAGGAYLPVGNDYPPVRIDYMLKDSSTALVLADPGLLSQLPGDTCVPVLTPDSPGTAKYPDTNPCSLHTAHDLAYVIYTSGSTGKPKGVLTRQFSLINRLAWVQDRYPLETDDTILQKTPLTFDVSVWELFWGPIYGGRTVLLTPGGEKDPQHVVDTIYKNRVTVIHFVPSALAIFLEYCQAHRLYDKLASLKRVFCSGEALYSTQADLFQRFIGIPFNTLLINAYGPTEAAIEVSCFQCPAPATATAGPEIVSIGKPIANTRLYILDTQGRLQPIGVAGELIIAGDNLAPGYLNNPALTAEKFPHYPHLHPSPVYRSGDLARWREDGNIEFIKRIDHQVKIRGFRIELGEIETALLTHDALREAVVTVKRDSHGFDYLCLYFTVHSGQMPEISQLRNFLAGKLPGYMIPSHFVRLEAMPLTSNAKIDRKELNARSETVEPQPEETLSTTDDTAGYAIQQKVAEIWSEVLGVSHIGPETSFFDAGGHSLLLVKVHTKLRQVFDTRLTVIDLFNYPTVRSLARCLAEERGNEPAAGSHPETADITPKERHDIAVIGMAGRFPGAPHIDRLWERLCNGEESLTYLSDEDLLAAGEDPELVNHPDYVKSRMVLENTRLFDAPFFDYTPREAETLDPQQRFFLEGAWEALEDAGCNPDQYEGRIGVFAGSGFNTYLINHLLPNKKLLTGMDDLQLLLGNDKDYLATRVSYKLDLKGPAFNVQTGCSTSLVAVHLACQSLRSGECDMALAGGVFITAPQERGYLYKKGSILSPDGHCRAFDAAANGTVFSSGMGIVVLKDLGSARRDNDHIYAVIKSSAINNDGARKVGFSAPALEGQSAVIKEALAQAGIPSQSIGYVETHGTGTELGDPIEAAALTKAFSPFTPGSRTCRLGSIKTNIGHLDAAAGIAGLIKSVLCLKHKRVPPSINFRQPNPNIDFENTPFYVNTSLEEWPREGSPRRAGVSSFGIGGTNAHVVLEEAPPEEPAADVSDCRLMVTSARSSTALERTNANLAAFLKNRPGVSLADTAYTLQVGRKAFDHRFAVLCHSNSEAVLRLDKNHPEGIYFDCGDHTQRPVIFLFPDSGLPTFQVKLALSLQERGVRPAGTLGFGRGQLAADCIAGTVSMEETLKRAAHLHVGNIPVDRQAKERRLREWLEDPRTLFMEIGTGPGASSLPMLEKHHESRLIRVGGDNDQAQPGIETILDSIARLWVRGGTVDWTALYRQEKRRRLPLPHYPFEREEYWIEAGSTVRHPSSTQGKEMEESVDAPLIAFRDREYAKLKNRYVAPQKEAEKIAVEIWEGILGIKPIGIEDDYFELGGHSLMAAQILSRLAEIFQVDIDIRELFETPTIKHIVGVLEQKWENPDVVEEIALTYREVEEQMNG
jgi:amino acid adenylation domain-containing protein